MEKANELLRNAANEIRFLRSQNQLMSARLEMFDSVMDLLHTDIPKHIQGVSPDLCYAIDKHLENENRSEKESLTKSIPTK